MAGSVNKMILVGNLGKDPEIPARSYKTLIVASIRRRRG